jgi:transcription-repair coupling factor (superfamily II helicase)
MSAASPAPIDELLIVSPTPQNLERGVLWFTENFSSLKKARFTNPWWRENALFLEKDLAIKPGEFVRRLMDLGYERAHTVCGKGLFAVRGGIIEVWPVNAEKPFLIEFLGNVVAGISERSGTALDPGPCSSCVATPKDSKERFLPGDYLVHEDHGIGIFRGRETQGEEEFFAVEYAPPAPGREPDLLLVPVSQKNRLAPYIGFETPSLHRLGGQMWERTKRKVREDAEKLARELLLLYGQRMGARRRPYAADEEMIRFLRDSFPYQETEDQLRAEEEILADFSSDHPMDRILCGDVGFGKTEIAVRSTLAAITAGYQVAVVAPTTILSSQHEKTFRERFRGLPVEIRLLSRLIPSREEKIIVKEIREGKADCVIGTHRLFSPDIQWKRLGLVIIDEEQRFGVRQKEYFTRLRASLDILSLSATPIPRTMQFALAKLRDISKIETPPPERLPIRTFVLPYSPALLGKAIAAELTRGGQVYFLHNRIETMAQAEKKIKNNLRRFLSRSEWRGVAGKIGSIHGRMKEKDIIRAMERFRSGETRLLLATTIIENGLDISNANTLIVEDAVRLGLAQAHQLRGRIGRGSIEAYAYFFYRAASLGEKASFRLEALKAFSSLGGGYEIALRDLEIRGAGNILGREQSGAINRVGFNLYCQILAEAVEQTGGKKQEIR